MKRTRYAAEVSGHPSGRAATQSSPASILQAEKVRGKVDPSARKALLVLGMHRSGTSTITTILQRLGAAAPKTPLPANFANPKGYAESRAIMDAHNRLLQSAGTRWSDWTPFNPDWVDSPAAGPFREELNRIYDEEFGEAPLAAIKDPRICRFAGFWLDLLERRSIRPLPVLPFRNPLEVAASLHKRDGMPLTHGALLWLRHVVDAERATRGRPRAFVNYHTVLDDWRSVAADLRLKLDIRWPRMSHAVEDEIDSWIEQSLRHQAATDKAALSRRDLAEWVRRVYGALLVVSTTGESTAALQTFDEVAAEFDKASDAFGRLTQDLETRAARAAEDTKKVSASLAAEAEKTKSAEARVALLTGELSAAIETAKAAESSSIALAADLAAAKDKVKVAEARIASLTGELTASLERAKAAEARAAKDAAAAAQAQAAELARSAQELAKAKADLATAVEDLKTREGELAMLKEASHAALAARDAEAARVLAEAESRAAESHAAVSALAQQHSAALAALAEVGKQDEQARKADIARLEEARLHEEKVSASLKAQCANLEEALKAARERIASLEASLNTTRAGSAAQAVSKPANGDGGGVVPPAGKFLSESPLVEGPEQLIDVEWYARTHATMPGAAEDPVGHYMTVGYAVDCDPNPLFSSKWYRATYPDVADRRINPLLHFYSHGAFEHRRPHPLFDTAWYVDQYPEAKPRNPLLDFITVGWQAGRNPNPWFEVKWFLARNRDVAKLGVNPLVHFDRFGAREGRATSPRFDTAWYRENYEDVRSSPLNPLAHFLLVGHSQGRRSVPRPEEAIREFQGSKSPSDVQKTILLVAHTVSPAGHFFGGERSFLDMAGSLSRLGYNLHVVLPAVNEHYVAALKDVVSSISIFAYDWWRAGQDIDAVAIERFEYLISKHGVDLVYANTIMLREPLQAARRRNVPCAVHCREIIDRDETLAAVIGEEPGEIVRAVRSAADLIVANSATTASLFFEDGAKGAIVPNVVDATAFPIRKRWSDSVIRVGIVSSNVRKKGIEDFAQVCARCSHLTNVEFHVYGPETDVIAELRNRVHAGLLPSSLKFKGYVSEPSEALLELDVVLCLSRFAESFGRTVAEAMAAQCLVIGYDYGAISELVENGETGYLVSLGDISSVVRHIERFAANPSEFRALRCHARDVIVARHSPKSMDEAYKGFLGGFLQERSSVEHSSKKRSKLRIAYFCWHFPVPSETFVLNELRVLLEDGHDVHVFCRQKPYPDFRPDFDVESTRVSSAEELAAKLTEFRADIIHGHFVYPTVTDMVWPAAEAARVPFTFIAHAQDIFRYENAKRSRIADIAKSPMCKAVFAPSHFHRTHFLKDGVLERKIIINPNGVDPARYSTEKKLGRRPQTRRVCAVHRYVEKKGLEHLIRAAVLLRDDGIVVDLYGYGPLEPAYRELIREIGATNVNLLGSLNTFSDLVSVLNSHDAFLCPSVRAADGDMDGIPTVLMDAMAVGTLVIATSISGIPDLVVDGVTGFICEASPSSIAGAIQRIYRSPPGKIDSIRNAARRKVLDDYNVRTLTKNLVRVWKDETVDIVIVSWNNLPELREVIRRIQAYTTYPYRLIICDNASGEEARSYLRQLDSENAQVEVVFNDTNSMVGPGTNIAASRGASEYIIYVCGKEGFVLNYNWELPFIQCLDENPDVALAGTLGYSPSYLYGRDFATGNAAFSGFRNRGFAESNPNREFRHVQGGLFSMRREALKQLGGFSEVVNHNGTDVELSFVAESEGWKLGQVKNAVSLYNKTRPFLETRFDESVRSVHPLRLEELDRYDAIVARQLRLCTLCGWMGPAFSAAKDDAICPRCGCSGDERGLWRHLAESTLTYRRLPALGLGLGEAITPIWKKQFQGRTLSHKDFLSALSTAGRLDNPPAKLSLIYAGSIFSSADSVGAKLAFVEFRRLLDPNSGVLILQDDPALFRERLQLHPNGDTFVGSSELRSGFRVRAEKSYTQFACEFGWREILVLERRQDA